MESASGEQGRAKTTSLIDLISPEWFHDAAASSIWTCGYRMLRVPPEQLASPINLDLENVRLLFLRGTLSYKDASSAHIDLRSEREIYFDSSTIKDVTSIEGTYLVVITPFMVDGREGNESETRDRIRSAIGLIIAFYSKAVIFKHLFDNIISLNDGSVSTFSHVIEYPPPFPPSGLSADSIHEIEVLNSALLRQDVATRDRVYLALRWLNSAAVELDHIDKVLKYWIAIETIAMPNTSNILPANQLLAQGYNLQLEEAKNRFRLGRVLNLRSAIIHDGARVIINVHLLRYMECLFVDLLSISLGVQCQRRAQIVIDEAWNELIPYLGQR